MSNENWKMSPSLISPFQANTTLQKQKIELLKQSQKHIICLPYCSPICPFFGHCWHASKTVGTVPKQFGRNVGRPVGPAFLKLRMFMLVEHVCAQYRRTMIGWLLLHWLALCKPQTGMEYVTNPDIHTKFKSIS